MKRSFTPIWLFVILLFLPLQFSFRSVPEAELNGPVIHLEGANGRFWVKPEGQVTVVSLCGLEVGAEYRVQLSANNLPASCTSTIDVSPLFVGDSQKIAAYDRGVLIRAKSDCVNLRLELGGTDCLPGYGDVMLSVARQQSKPQLPPPSSMLAPAISTTPGIPVTTLVEDFLIGGDCFDVSGITQSGSPNQKGTFINGATSIGFTDGIILSTGNTSIATGPNNQTGASTDEPNSATDPDLADIIGGAGLLNDVAKIEFDFTPTVDTIRFNYVFASEEYCDFTNTGFNDVFGFFISGPGINGPYQNNAANIAVIPGTATPVTINNVNHVNNSAFYVGNIPAGSGQLFNGNCNGHPVAGPPSIDDCQFDGYTVMLTAEAVVIPCSTYHIKLAIADVLDGLYDSAVFFEANSLELGGETKVEAVGTVDGTNIVYEGCTGAYFEFTRDDLTDLSEPQVINFTISVASTADNGVDYVTIPLSVTIPPGQTSVQIPVDAFNDQIPEGQETIILELESPCTCSLNEIEMIIDDPPAVETPLDDVEICEGDGPVTLDATATGGIPSFTYDWSTGATSPTINVDPLTDETFYVTVTDDCGNTTVDSATVSILAAPTANLTGGGTFCENGGPATIDLTVTFTGTGPWTFTYSENGQTQPPITTSDNPYILTVDAIGNYTLVNVGNGGGSGPGCPGTVSGNAVVSETVLSPTTNATDPLCNGDSNGSVFVSVSGGTPAYTYQWDNGAGTGQNPGNLPAGTYNVTVTDANGCTETASVTINEPPLLDATISSVQNVDCNNPGGNISVSVTGGTPGYNYSWSDGSSGANPGNLPPGTYDVTVTDANGCTDTASGTIIEDITPPTAIANVTGEITCAEPTITLDGIGSSTGSDFIYNWTTNGGNIVSGGNTLEPVVDAPGTYTLTVTNTANGCEETAVVTVGQDITPPVATAVADPITCDDPTIVIDGSGSSSGSDFTYSWTTNDGNIVSGGNTANPTVDQPGTYTITVTNESNGCESAFSVQVPDDTTPPAVNATGGNLTCVVSQLLLDGSGSAIGPDFTYQWTTTDGNIVSGETTLNPLVDQVGTYTLEVTNGDNGCTNTVSVFVGSDTTPPIANAGPSQEINCANLTINLDGTGSQSGPGITYSWTTNDGQILGGGNTTTPTVNEPGTYTITVVNTNNGCESTDEVIVTEDTALPSVAIGPPELINCYVPEITLDGTGSSVGSEFSYQWITSNGNIVSGENTLNPVVDQAGFYTLIVSNSDNFCSDQLSVVVLADLAFPVANAGPDMEITCTVTEVTLLGLGSSNGPEFVYEWTTATGNILSGGDTPTPLVNEPGVYDLTVTNTTNGCESTSSVTVTVDDAVPIADAGPNQLLNCVTPNVVLDGSNSSAIGNVFFQWSTVDGNIVSGINTLTPLVDAPGVYELQIINNDNGCIAFSTAIVDEDTTIPTIIIEPPVPITCDEPLLVLDASGSTSQGDLDFIWIPTNGGNIVDGENTLTPTVDAGGTYTLNIVNFDNFCSNSGSISVVDVTDYPIITVGDPETLTCGVTEVTIDAIGSENGPGLDIAWTTSDGNIVSGGNTLEPVVDLSGTYTLSIFDTSNNCLSEEDIFVPANLALPIVDAGAEDTLNCVVQSMSLGGSASGSPQMDFSWTTPDGNIVSGADGLDPVIDAPGTYVLEVLNLDNECVDTDQVTIAEDVTIPLVDAGAGSEINCYEPSFDLDGTASDQGNTFAVFWDTPDGNIVGGGNTYTPTVDAGGTYWIYVLNTNNQCIDSAAVVMDEDLLLPLAEAGPDAIINCYALELNLDGSGSDLGPEFVFNWDTPNGNIVSGSDTPEPLIDAPGTYNLTLTNTDNGCVASDLVDVGINLTDPIIDAGIGGELTCTESTIQLLGNAQGNVPDFVYSWTTPDGNILSGDDALDPVVDAPGDYTLTVTDTENGCSVEDVVTVTQDANLPTAIINPDSSLNCVNSLVTLDGTSSTQGPDISFEWQVSGGGNIVNGDNTLSPLIDAPGQYTLIITDAANDCVDQTTLTVTPDTINPLISFLPPAILTCDVTDLDLTAEVVTGSGTIQITWTTPDGNLVDGIDGLEPTVDAPGTYVLEIVDTNNGCESEASVDVVQDIADPIVDISDPAILTCAVTELDLEGTFDAGGANTVLDWTTTDGNIVSGADSTNPVVDAPGTYTFQVTNTDNGCITELSIPVDQNIVPPAVEAGPPDILNCDVLEVSLDGSGTAQGSSYSYQWFTTDGNIISGINDLDPTVNSPGTYVLEVVDAVNACVSVDSTIVDQDISLPITDAGPPGLLTCLQVDYQLQGTGSAGPSFTYAWTTTDGNIVSGANTPDPLVDAPGSYVLEILNTQNGCETYDTVTVAEDVLFPDALTEEADLLTCAVTSIALSGNGSSVGPEFSYSWTTSDGNILSGDDGLDPQVDQPGTYTLFVTDTSNGCVSEEIVEVDQDIELPIADPGAANTLTCTLTSFALDGQGSSQGPEFTYLWTTADGNIVTGADTDSPLIDAPGQYELVVINTFNGCVSTAEVEIDEDVVAPGVVILEPAILTCTETIVMLDATGSSSGNYTWTTADGNIVGGVNSANPEVNEPGTYNLEIVDPANGCVSEEAITVSQNVIYPDVEAGPAGELTCLVTSLSLEGAASGNSTDLQIQWSSLDGNIISGSTGLNPVIDAPGTYTITVTDAENGCVSTDITEVVPNNLPPQVAAGDPDILTCLITEVDLNGTGSEVGSDIVYQWTTSDGSILSDPSMLIVQVDAPGTYTLQVLNTYTGCLDAVTIEVDQNIEAPVVDAGEDWILPCYDETVVLNGAASGSTSQLSYNWSTADGTIVSGAQSLSPSVASEGFYELVVTNLVNGCTSSDLTEVIEIRPELATWAPASPLCVGDFGVLVAVEVEGGTPPYIYSIDGGETFTTGSVFQPLDPGLYDVVVQDALGCELNSVEIIEAPQEVLVDLEPRVELQFGDSYQLEALTNLSPGQIGSIEWTPATGLSCSDCLDPVATPLETTEYEVVITDVNGCPAEGRITLVVDKRPAIYVPNVFSPDGDGDNDIFYIFAKDGTVTKIQSFLVFSRWGESVFEYYNFQPNNPAYGWDGNHRGEPLNPAVFAWFAVVEMADGRIEVLEGDVTLVR